MASWIEFHTSLRDHWKIDRLKDALNIPYAHALGLIGCVWTWAATQAQNGDLSRFTDAEISRAARWEGRWDGFKNVLKSCGLLDDKEKINDWHKHGIRILKSSRKRQEEHRKKLRDSNVTVTSALRPSFFPSIPSILSIKHTPLPPLTEQERGALNFLNQPPLNAVVDPEEFVRLNCAAYGADFVLEALKEVIAYCAQKPEWAKNRKSWNRTISGWFKRKKEQVGNAKAVKSMSQEVGQNV